MLSTSLKGEGHRVTTSDLPLHFCAATPGIVFYNFTHFQHQIFKFCDLFYRNFDTWHNQILDVCISTKKSWIFGFEFGVKASHILRRWIFLHPTRSFLHLPHIAPVLNRYPISLWLFWTSRYDFIFPHPRWISCRLPPPSPDFSQHPAFLPVIVWDWRNYYHFMARI